MTEANILAPYLRSLNPYLQNVSVLEHAVDCHKDDLIDRDISFLPKFRHLLGCYHLYLFVYFRAP